MNYSNESRRAGDSQADGGDTGRVILVVDASPTAEQHAAELEREFDHIVTAETVEDALARLSTTPIDCVVSTYELPDEDGIELVKRIRSKSPTIPVILWPDSGDEHIASKAIAANVTGYVPRRENSPGDYESIVNCIQDAISTHSDSAECDRIDTTIQLVSEVCCDFLHAETRAKAFKLTVQRVCESTDWDYGEVWRPNDDREALGLETSYPDTNQFTSFATMSNSITFQPNEGLPGRVWATGSEEWISDVSDAPAHEYIRTAAVAETPLKTAFGVPVRNGESIDAVLVFYSVNELLDESPLRTMVNAVQRVLNECSSENHVLEGDGSGSVLPYNFQEDERTEQSEESPLRILADHVNVTLWMATPEFEEIVYTSSNFERIAGISPDEFQENPHSLLDIVHPDDRDDVQHTWETRADAYTLEYRVQPAEGDTRWIKEQGTPVEQNGELQYFVGTAEDITERKQQEQELRRQQELLRHTEELAQTGGWIADLNTGQQRWTNGTKAIHDVPSDFEPTIEAGIEFFHPDDRETIERVFNRCAETGEPYDVELRIITAEGRERWVRATGEPVSEDGEITKVCGAIQNITDRKQREQQLEAERRKFQSLVDVLPHGVYRADPETLETTYANEAFEMINGYQADEWRDTQDLWAQSLHPDDAERVRKTFQAHQESREPGQLEYRIQTPDGDTRWIEDTFRWEYDDAGNVTALVGVYTDITDRKNRERELEQARSQMELALEVTDAVVWQWDFETDTVITYPDTHHLLNADVETVDDFFTEIHPDDRDAVKDALDTAIETDTAYDVEFRVPDDETVRWIDDYGEMRNAGERAAPTMIGVARDVTDQKEREQELRHEREHLQQTERLAQSGGWRYDCETESLQITDGFRRLFGLPDDHNLDLDESFECYHPDDRETLIEAFERCRRTGDSYEIEVRIVTSQGNERWIHEHGERITENGVQNVRGAVRDITTRKRYENALKGVNAAARDLLTDETDAEIAHTIVDTATSVLDATGVAVYLYDEQSEKLVPTATSEEIEQLLDELPRFAPGDSIAWDVFASQQPAHYDDVRTADHVYRAGTPIRSEYILPLGEHGVLLIGDTEIDAFSDLTSDIVTILASTAEAALDRAERTQALHKRERESQRQAQQLERVEQLNEQIRSIIKAIVQSGSSETIKQIVCDSLATHEDFEGIWIGEPNLATDEVVRTATSGPIDQYLDSVSLDLDPENTLPAVQAVRNRTSVVEGNIAARPHQDTWRHPALLSEFRSVISVPLIYEDILYGVLTIYSTQSNVFDDSMVSVLTELGELIGYVLNSITQRHARLADEMIGLRFVLAGTDGVFVELASQLNASIHIESISTRTEDRFLVHFSVPDTDPEDVIAIAESVPSIENIELIADGSSPRFEVITLGECIGTQIEQLGAHLRTVTIDEESCEIQILIPHDRDVETFVRHLNEKYPDAELATHKNNTERVSTSCRWVLDEHLTEKQKNTLTTAYYSGYFDQTRKRKGGEIAESLGISQPGFAKQLRAAEYNLLSTMLE